MSLLPEPTAFSDQYDDEKLARELPDRPITSLRDLQYVYGRLYTLAADIGGEYSDYLTPWQASDLFGEPESLIYIRVDMSGKIATLDSEKPVGVKQYDEEKAEAAAHSWFDSARGYDHSITHRTGKRKTPTRIAKYLHERLTSWATDEVVQQAAAEHEDGWVINSLAALGDQDGIRTEIKEAVEQELDGKTTALTSVAVRTEQDGEYHLPGECQSTVFNEAMREHKREKLVSKGEATKSEGNSQDLLTGSEGRTVGTSEDPLNYFLGKQLEKFPNLDPNKAWRTHPVSEETAITLINATPFVDACDYYTMGANVYYLPYFFGRLQPRDARVLYRMLYNVVQEEDMTPIEGVYREFRNDPALEAYGERFRFYVTAVMEHQTKRFDVFGDTLDGSLLTPVELVRQHLTVLDSWLFDVQEDIDRPVSSLRPAFPAPDSWDTFVPDEHVLLSTLTTGWYFEQTFAPEDDDDASADDYRIQALVAILSGEPLDVEAVLTEYVDRLLEDEGEEFPSFRIAAQYAQLCALAGAGLLTGDNAYAPVAEPQLRSNHLTDNMHSDTPTRADGGSITAARETKLEQFLDQTPALAEDQPERRGSFLLGALVGQVTGYQQVSEGRSTTLIDQYPIKAVTESKLKRLASDVLDKNVVYSRENNMAGTMYREVVDRLVTTLPRIGIDGDWELDTTDLRFYYSLGVAYGMNNWASSDDEQADDQPAATEEGA